MKKFFIPILMASSIAVAGTTKEVECLTKNIYHEARGEGKAGMYAVADVTLNRLESKRFPNTICNVVYQYRQFSWTLKEPPITDAKSYEISRTIAWKAINGKNRGITDGSLWYHESNIFPRWASRKSKQVVINNHIFYTAKI